MDKETMMAGLDSLEAEVADIKKALCDLEKRDKEGANKLADYFLSLRARLEKIDQEARQLREEANIK